MTNYKPEIKTVFEMMVANNPYSYKDTDFTVLSKDWSYHFDKNNIPVDRILDIYHEVIAYKAATNNMYGIITNVDMIHAWTRILARTSGMINQATCQICGNSLAKSAGYIKTYCPSRNKDILTRCGKEHAK